MFYYHCIAIGFNQRGSYSPQLAGIKSVKSFSGNTPQLAARMGFIVTSKFSGVCCHKGEIFGTRLNFILPNAIYHRKTGGLEPGDIDSLYVINPVFSIYISQLVGHLLFHFFCFVKSFFIVHDVPSPW